MYNRYFFILIIIGTVLLSSGCKKDNASDPNTNPTTTVSMTISGIVLDEFESPIAGAQVTSAGQTVMSSGNGAFTLSKIAVPKGRFVVNVTKSGYFDGNVADVPVANGTKNIKVYLLKGDETKTVSVSSGGSIQMDNGSAVDLPANSVVNNDGSPVNGNVKMTVGYLDPTSENFASQIPGGDLRAVTSNNTETTLYSYGIIKVDLKNESGSQVKLKSGTQSKITVDIPPSMESTAPSTIPLWHFDTNTGLWKEEGSATKQGDKYVGYVGHFSDWNCDVPGGTGTVKGLVLDCNNAPVQGITVKIGQGSTTTNADGRFERRVPINVNFEVQVMANKNFGLSSTPIPVTGLTEGTVKDVGTIKIECPAYVAGQIKCGSEIKYGQVVVSWSGGHSAQFTDNDGKFKIPVDINKNAQVSVNTIDGKYRMVTTLTPASRGTVKDLGVIEACDQTVLGENKFTLNGDGFTNKTYIFANDTTEVFGYYDPDSAATYVWMNKENSVDTVFMLLTFSGNSTGAGRNVLMYLIKGDKMWVAYSFMPGYDAAVNVTKYSGVGGLIEGTFTGKLFSYQTSFQTFTTLSNGKFSVVRLVGQNDVLRKHLPAKYYNRMFKK